VEIRRFPHQDAPNTTSVTFDVDCFALRQHTHSRVLLRMMIYRRSSAGFKGLCSPGLP
jgi:hypothetical protein